MKRANESNGSNDLAEGTRLLDRYTILDRVGTGGMASIYRATDERLDRVVCVKLLRLILEGSGDGPQAGAGAARGRNVYRATYSHFLKEALALSKLSHPNTLRIYDFGYLSDGSPFQISEFLDGGNLETQVRATGPLTEEEALAVLERIVGAIAEAHSHGIIHRDIKPSNILFSHVGEVLMPKLADFGIAQSKLRRGQGDQGPDAVPLSEEHSDLISTVALFSPRWAAPEQLAGSPEGPGTDVYALGLVTAFMLTGRVAFADNDVRSHFGDRIRGDAFVASRLEDLGLSIPIRDVLLRALTADQSTRMSSPEAFYEALRDAIGARVPRSLPTGVFRRPFESITLLTDHAEVDSDREDHGVAPVERLVYIGGRKVRLVEINEKLDVSVTGVYDLRFRVTMLPSRSDLTENPAGFAINVKGLNCFVAKASGRPTPAIVAKDDGEAFFVNGDKTHTGTLRWSFGTPSTQLGPGAGRVFAIGGKDLVVTYTEASQAVALDLGPEREIVVMCKR